MVLLARRVVPAPARAGRPTTRSRAQRRTRAATLSIDVNGVPHQAQIAVAKGQPALQRRLRRGPEPAARPRARHRCRAAATTSRPRSRTARSTSTRSRSTRACTTSASRTIPTTRTRTHACTSTSTTAARSSRAPRRSTTSSCSRSPTRSRSSPGQSSLRLESYLFTKEAIESARDHLTPGGVVHDVQLLPQPWLPDRYANTLDEVYGHAPCVDQIGPVSAGALTCSSRRAAELRRCATRTWHADRHRSRSPPPTTTRSRTCATRSLPAFYLVHDRC